MRALKSPGKGEPLWQRVLPLAQAVGVWDAAERARCRLCFKNVPPPSLRPQGGTSPALQKHPGRALGALPAAEEDVSICPIAHGSSAKKGSQSSPGDLAGKGRLCRQRGDQLSASPVLLSSAFSSFLVCLWPKRRAFPCSAPLPGGSVSVCDWHRSGCDWCVADAAAAAMPAASPPLPPALPAAPPLVVFPAQCVRGEAPSSSSLLRGASGRLSRSLMGANV